MSDKPKGALALYGRLFIENGYRIIPIVRGTKRPPPWMEKGDSWTKQRSTPALLEEWLKRPDLRGAGIGILSEQTPGVDIDCRVRAIVEETLDDLYMTVGFSPRRIGLDPKTLVLCALDGDPFPKATSHLFVDGNGFDCKLEVLGKGQQYVAAGIHPDTKKGYYYPDKDDPRAVPVAALAKINKAQAQDLVARFNERCVRHGLERKKAASSTPPADADDWTATLDKEPVGLSIEALRAHLTHISADAYETWQQVGAAIWHETAGSDEGLELWTEWSATSAKYHEGDCDRKWPSFDHGGKDRAPLTARFILKLAKEATKAETAESVAAARKAIGEAKTTDDLRDAAEAVKRLDLDDLTRETLAGLVQQTHKRLHGTTLAIGLARGLVRREEAGKPEMPRWMRPWVYITGEDLFYNRITRSTMTPTAFNHAHGRNLLTDKDRREGRAYPAVQPVDAALNLHSLPQVDGRMYAPGEEDIFTWEGQRRINTYTDAGVPITPETLSVQEKADVARVVRHLEILIPDARSRALLVSWLAFVVKHTGSRVRWCPVLQGVEGAGKTFIAEMMKALLGPTNVKVVGLAEVESDFNAYAEGSQLNVLEEMAAGLAKRAVMNTLKPLITNDVVPIHRKRESGFNAKNTASYLILSNHRNAVDITDRDRRYMPIFSSLQNKEDLAALEAKEPFYFDRLFEAAYRSPGAIRKWLLDFQPHPEFNANGRAPKTAEREEVIELAKSDERVAIEDILAEGGEPGLTRGLLNATALSGYLKHLIDGGPKTSALKAILMEVGLTPIGRARVDGRICRFWSDRPNLFLTAGKIDQGKIRAWLEEDI